MVAGVGGFEPPTHGFGDRRSDQAELYPSVLAFCVDSKVPHAKDNSNSELCSVTALECVIGDKAENNSHDTEKYLFNHWGSPSQQLDLAPHSGQRHL